MSYDGFYGDLSQRGTVNEILDEAKQVRDDVLEAQAVFEAGMSEFTAGVAAVEADRIATEAAATIAADAAAAAANSQAMAFGHETEAMAWATNPVDVEVDPGKFSAYHWAQKAELAAEDATDLRADLATPSGANMVGTLKNRTLEKVLDDFVSVRDFPGLGAVDGVTSNQVGIQNAVDYCLANGCSLYWPRGTYVSTASISNFHNIPHFGDGVIKRGTDTFKMNQRGGQRNIIYVSTTGSDLNDGLSASQPFVTIQMAATKILFGWEDNLLKGAWRLQLAAGTYGRATVLRSIRNAERFQVWGPEVNWTEPTAVVNNTLLEDSVVGLYLNTLDRWEVRNVKFTNFTGYQGQGVAASASSDFYCVNVWADNCGWAGIFMQGGEVFRVEGGKVTNCREGIVAYIGVRFTIGYNSSAHPTLIQGCTQAGFSAYNASAGHVDYAEISNCPTGAAIVNQSRVDFMGAKIMGCSVGIGADSLSTYIKNTEESILFNSGAPNTVNERCRGNSVPNEFINNFQFLPASRQHRWGFSWSGAAANSTYKYVFEQQTGDSGIALLSPDGSLSSLTFGRASNNIAGRVTYDHAADQWRLICNGANTYYASSSGFGPYSNGTPNLGGISNRWNTVYAVTGTINTSDASQKTPVRTLEQREIDAAKDLVKEVGAFKWLASVATKGEDARDHIGLTVQRAIEVMESHGLEPFKYGFICYDEWEAREGGEDEEPTPAGSLHSFRFDQLSLFLAVGLNARLEALEAAS